MHRHVQHTGVFLENVLDAVAMVDVKVCTGTAASGLAAEAAAPAHAAYPNHGWAVPSTAHPIQAMLCRTMQHAAWVASCLVL